MLKLPEPFKVSIVIPVFNGANYLRFAIESALAQTYADVEVIVVNDGSTDEGRTDSIARQFGDRIIYIEQENRGVAGALNTGIARMSGSVFTWLSHDDIFLSEKIQSQVSYYKALGLPEAILFSDFYLINETGQIVHESKLPYDTYIKAPMLPLLNAAINGCTLFIPAPILHEIGPFDENLRYVQDYELWNKILSKYEFFLQPRPLIKYRIHPGQDTNKPGAVEEAEALWVRIVEARSEVERVQLFGSTQRFYAYIADFLSRTPYKKAAERVRGRIARVLPETLVSIVLPFGGHDAAFVVEAALSVLAQTHVRLELILIDHGVTGNRKAISALVATDNRARLVWMPPADQNAACNRGMRAARGDYIAFIAPGDRFTPRKIAVQLAAMQEAGSLISHTAYAITSPQGVKPHTIASDLAHRRVSGDRIEAQFVSFSTVMLHYNVLAAGFWFASSNLANNERAFFDAIAAVHPLLGIQEALTVLGWCKAAFEEDGRAAPAIGRPSSE